MTAGKNKRRSYFFSSYICFEMFFWGSSTSIAQKTRRRSPMGAKQCDLCDRAAMMYCESDQASLCWECDAKVHGANFIVARHARRLLCRRCQLPTPWRAEGAKLGPAVSVCERCCGFRTDSRVATEAESRRRPQGDGFGEGAVREDDEGVEDEDEDEEEDEEEEEEEEEEDEEEDEDGENQVVPWTSMPPPPVASSSSSEDEGSVQIGRNRGQLLKRSLEGADLSYSQENLALSSAERSHLVSAPNASEDEGTSLADAFHPWANGFRKRPVLIRSATPAQSAAAEAAATVLDVRVYGELVANGLVSSRSCLPPM